jgi:serine/threonine protein kinase
MLRSEGGAEGEEAILIDFSIAIVKDANEALYGLSRAAGTFDYMAPEQAIGYAHAPSDVYSLAKVALEMLTGRRLSELLPEAALDLPQRVTDMARNIEPLLSDESMQSLAAALEFDPAKRPQHAGAFVNPLVRDLMSLHCARGPSAAAIFCLNPSRTGPAAASTPFLRSLLQSEGCEIDHVDDAGACGSRASSRA